MAACSSNNQKFTIIGNINGMPQQTVVLEQINANDVITVIDSERSSSDGHFELSAATTEPSLYRLHFNQGKFILLSITNGNVKVSADWNKIEEYKVEGSPSSAQLKAFIVSTRTYLNDFNTMSIVLDTLKARGNDSVLQCAMKDRQDMGEKFTRYIERYADTTPYEPNVVFAARILNPAVEAPFIDAMAQSLNKRFPNTKMSHDFNEYWTKVSAKYKAAQPAKSKVSTETGQLAPDLNLPTADGKMIALSSLRGKYVLLDFWASWCAPCRQENPNVVAAYNKYKDQNFTVYSVSLDNNKEQWMKAIKDDELVWPTHVSDLKGWASDAAKTYSIQSIPSNVLIDPKGNIIARNLRGSQLEEMLQAAIKPAP